MPKLASYYLPGLYIEDHAVDVPLDWRGHEPAQLAADGLPDGERIQLFYRTVCTPENVGRDLPLLVFLQGGPGGAGPRLLSPTSDGWIEEATKHFRVVLPDQRGTGRSSHVSRHALEARGDARSQAEFLKRVLAPSIVRDFEYLRLTEFGGRSWTTLGQSYGGWLTLTYLSFYPAGIAASLTCGAIPHLPANADEVYAHTFPRMAAKTRAYYERYPAAGAKPQLTDGFLMGALQSLTTAGDPLYWVLQELIYADGTLEQPIRWSAAREYASRPEFSADARPLMLVAEACLPWMFEDDPLLVPFKPTMDLLMEDTKFDRLYDPARLAANEVPLQAAVYFDDAYVDSGLQLDTLSRMPHTHAWVTNEFEHDGLHGSAVFKRLFEEAKNRGDLERALRS